MLKRFVALTAAANQRPIQQVFLVVMQLGPSPCGSVCFWWLVFKMLLSLTDYSRIVFLRLVQTFHKRFFPSDWSISECFFVFINVFLCSNNSHDNTHTLFSLCCLSLLLCRSATVSHFTNSVQDFRWVIFTEQEQSFWCVTTFICWTVLNTLHQLVV